MATLAHPWNARLAEALSRSLDTLPHAILFAGPSGLGKMVVAEWLAQLLLCESPREPGRGCGECHSCRLMLAGSHPDLHVVQPESDYKQSDTLLARYAVRYPPADKNKDRKDSTVIRIDQVRSLIAASQGRPQIARRRLMILTPTDRMNVNAANALLKLLEEPPPDSHLILVADRPNRLPPTIRSRCIRIDFHPPEPTLASAWLVAEGVPAVKATELLALSGGAPLVAIEMYRSGFLGVRDELVTELEGLLNGRLDPVSCASRWKERGADHCLRWLQGWLADLANPVPAGIHNPGSTSRLQALQKRLHLKQLFRMADAVGVARSRLGSSLDEQLALEETLIRWTQLKTTSAS